MTRLISASGHTQAAERAISPFVVDSTQKAIYLITEFGERSHHDPLLEAGQIGDAAQAMDIRRQKGLFSMARFCPNNPVVGPISARKTGTWNDRLSQ